MHQPRSHPVARPRQPATLARRCGDVVSLPASACTSARHSCRLVHSTAVWPHADPRDVRHTLAQAVRHVAPKLGGSFAVWGGLFSAFDCTLVAVRKKVSCLPPVLGLCRGVARAVPPEDKPGRVAPSPGLGAAPRRTTRRLSLGSHAPAQRPRARGSQAQLLGRNARDAGEASGGFSARRADSPTTRWHRWTPTEWDGARSSPTCARSHEHIVWSEAGVCSARVGGSLATFERDVDG